LERVAGTAITIARSIHLDELAMRLFSFVLATVLCSAVGVAAAAAAVEPQPYALKDTEVQTLHAAHLGRDYELFVSLPASYAAGSRSYPVVFVTDAPYAFPLTRAIEARVTGHSQELPEFILVGLGYGKGDTPEYSRRRDYTTPASAPTATWWPTCRPSAARWPRAAIRACACAPTSSPARITSPSRRR
jgi:hypothetical protein